MSPVLVGHSRQPRGLEGAMRCTAVSGHGGEELTGILAKIQHAKMMWHIADVQSFELLRTCIYLLSAIFPN